MSTRVPGFQSFLRFLQHFELAKLATSSIRVMPTSTNVVWRLHTFEINSGIIHGFMLKFEGQFYVGFRSTIFHELPFKKWVNLVLEVIYNISSLLHLLLQEWA